MAVSCNFGMAPPPVLQDTTLLEEEIVNVEVKFTRISASTRRKRKNWKKRAKNALIRACIISAIKIVSVGSEKRPEVRTGNEGKSDIACCYDPYPYYRDILGRASLVCKDVYHVDLRTGVNADRRESMDHWFIAGYRFAYWYSYPDSAWYAYSVERQLRKTGAEVAVPFYDELNDSPIDPSPYGIAG